MSKFRCNNNNNNNNNYFILVSMCSSALALIGDTFQARIGIWKCWFLRCDKHKWNLEQFGVKNCCHFKTNTFQVSVLQSIRQKENYEQKYTLKLEVVSRKKVGVESSDWLGAITNCLIVDLEF